MPQRLVELLGWLDTVINDEAGWFPEFGGSSLVWYLRPVDISPYFGALCSLGDGSQLAYWFYEDCDPRNPPVVVLGCDGDMGVAANSIEELVARLVRGEFPQADWVVHMSNFYLNKDTS